jgi:hypothetical protein
MTGRRLMAGSIRIETSIKVADKSSVNSITKSLIVDRINGELNKVGMSEKVSAASMLTWETSREPAKVCGL